MNATGTTGHTSAATSSTIGPTSIDAVTGTAEAAATSTGDETSAATSTSSETSEASVTVATTDTTSDTTTTTISESSTGEPSGVLYTAKYHIGQIDRIAVYRADFDADNCAFINFAGDGTDPDMAVTLPRGWTVEYTQISQGTSFCLGGEPSLEWEQADSVMGMADFELFVSCDIDIDVIATFPQTEPWVPSEIHFLATGLPIEGAC